MRRRTGSLLQGCQHRLQHRRVALHLGVIPRPQPVGAAQLETKRLQQGVVALTGSESQAYDLEDMAIFTFNLTQTEMATLNGM